MAREKVARDTARGVMEAGGGRMWRSSAPRPRELRDRRGGGPRLRELSAEELERIQRARERSAEKERAALLAAATAGRARSHSGRRLDPLHLTLAPSSASGTAPPGPRAAGPRAPQPAPARPSSARARAPLPPRSSTSSSAPRARCTRPRRDPDAPRPPAPTRLRSSVPSPARPRAAPGAAALDVRQATAERRGGRATERGAPRRRRRRPRGDAAGRRRERRDRADGRLRRFRRRRRRRRRAFADPDDDASPRRRVDSPREPPRRRGRADPGR